MIESIENHNLVIDHFGYWPDFHDAEIIRISCNRNFDTSWPSIEFRIYAFEMTDKVVGRYFKLIKHCIIDIELVGVVESELIGFNHQNAINGIEFGKEEDLITVEIDHAYGVSGFISTHKARINNLEKLEDDPKKLKK